MTTEEIEAPDRSGEAQETHSITSGTPEVASTEGAKRRPFFRRYAPRRRVCLFCVEKIDYIDYKDVSVLRRFMSDRGRIQSKRRSGNCAKHQRTLAVAIKRARHLALLPFTSTHIRKMGWVIQDHPKNGLGDSGRGEQVPTSRDKDSY